MGFCALFEVNHGILCLFGRSSWNFVIKSHEELPKMHKIPLRNFQKSYEELQKLHNIPLGTSKNAQDVFGTCLVLSVNCVHILA
jgi:hypothetical protein